MSKNELQQDGSNHLVVLSPGFPRDEEDTACLTYLQNYILAFKETYPDWKISVITLQYPFHSEQYEWHGIEVLPLGLSTDGRLLRSLNWVKVYRIISRLHREQPIDVLHSLWLKDCCVVGYFVQKRFGIRHVCTAMGADVLPQKNRFLKWLPFRKLDVITVSHFQDTLLKQYRAHVNTAVIPWGIGSKAEAVRDKRPIDILNVGFLNDGKELPLFIETIKLLKETMPALKVVIIGEDYSDGQLQKLIDTYDLSDQITMTGKLPNEEVITYMGQSRVMVHTSRYESLGYVFLEALREGMRVVSREVGLAQASPYWYIAEDNPVSFATKVTEALASVYAPISRIPYPVSDTVTECHNLYMAPKN